MSCAALAVGRRAQRAVAGLHRQGDDHAVLELLVALLDLDGLRPRLAGADHLGPAAVELERQRAAVVDDLDHAAGGRQLGLVDRAADDDLDRDAVVVVDAPRSR